MDTSFDLSHHNLYDLLKDEGYEFPVDDDPEDDIDYVYEVTKKMTSLKMLQIRVVLLWIPYKKVNGYTCVSPSKVSLWGSEHCHVWNIIIYSQFGLDGSKKYVSFEALSLIIHIFGSAEP